MDELAISASSKETKPFSLYRVFIPILLGLVVIGWLFISEFDLAVFSTFNFTVSSILFILLAFVLMLLRDLGLILRFRHLTDNQLTWKQAFQINVLSEFTSAVTPAAVGGSSLVVLFLVKEGISAGRSTTIMFVNLFLDELFFIIICPIIFLLIPINEIFNSSSAIVSTFGVIFVTLYFTRLVWTATLFISIFKYPNLIKVLLLLLFKLPFLKRWYVQIENLTDNLILTSYDIGHRSVWFWLKAFGMTLLTWTARFLVVNAVFMAFAPVSSHIIVFARQLVLWVVLVVSPTPGGSGVTEYAFKEYYSDIFSSNSAIIFITLIWRLISYYLYLLLGVLVIPNWVKKHFSQKQE